MTQFEHKQPKTYPFKIPGTEIILWCEPLPHSHNEHELIIGENPENKMTQFEHIRECIAAGEPQESERLSLRSTQGWELLHVFNERDFVVYYWKRPIIPPMQTITDGNVTFEHPIGCAICSSSAVIGYEPLTSDDHAVGDYKCEEHASPTIRRIAGFSG